MKTVLLPPADRAKYGAAMRKDAKGLVDINEPEMIVLVELYLLGSVRWSERHLCPQKSNAYVALVQTWLVDYEGINDFSDYILTLTDEGREFVTRERTS